MVTTPMMRDSIARLRLHHASQQQQLGVRGINPRPYTSNNLEATFDIVESDEILQ